MRAESMDASISTLLIEPDSGGDSPLWPQFEALESVVGSVHTAEDGRSALTVLSEEHVDCVVCLHDPPALDGVAVLSELRGVYPDMPVLLASEPDTADEVIDAGPTDLVQLTDGTLHDGVVTNRIASVVAQARQRGKYEQLFEQANDAILIHHPESGEIIEANSKLYDLMGYDPETADTLSVEDILPEEGRYSEERARELIQATTEDDSRTFEWRNQDADGNPVWVEVNLEVTTLGGVERVLAFVRDISERRVRERVLREFHEVATNTDRSFADKVDVLLDIGADAVGAKYGTLSRIRGDEYEFEFVRAPDDTVTAGDTVPLSATNCERAVATEETLALANIAADAPDLATRDGNQELGTSCYLGAPIEVNGEMYGTVCFYDDEPREAFSEWGRTLVDLLSQWIESELEAQEHQRELEEERAQLEETLERIDTGFFAVDDEWQFTYTNEEGEAIIRRAMDGEAEADELIGRRFWDEIPEIVGTTFYEKYHEAVRVGESVFFEEYYEPLETWFEVQAYPDESGLSVFFMDVTQRKNREIALNDLIDASSQFLRTTDRGDLTSLVLESAVDILGYELATVRLYDSEAETLLPTAVSTGVAETLGELPAYDIDEHPVGEAFQSDDTVIIDDSDATKMYGDDDDEPIGSAMFLSLGQHGLLTIGSYHPGAFDEEDQTLAELLATTATAALDRVGHEETLRQYHRVIEQVESFLFLLDSDGRFQLVTEPLATRLGYDSGWLEGREFTEFVADEAVPDCRSRIEAVGRSTGVGHASFETTVVTETGDEVPLEVELSGVAGGADSDGLVGSAADVTERNRYKTGLEALAEASYRLWRADDEQDVAEATIDIAESVLDESLVTMWSHDERDDELVPTAVSDTAIDVTNADEAVDFGPISTGTAEMRVFQGGEMTVIENHPTVDGSSNPKAPLGTLVAAPLGDHGQLHVGSRTASGFDETSRRLIETLARDAEAALDRVDREQDLERSYERLARTEQLADVGGWELDLETETQHWTDGTRRLHEVSEDFEPDLESGINFYHPDDREMIRQVVEECYETGRSFEVEARLRTAEGNTRWINTTVKAVSKDGDVSRLEGAIRDISNKKQREQQLTVLYRILRHNLRNDLNVVQGFCDPIADAFERLEPAPEIEGREIDVFDALVENGITTSDVSKAQIDAFRDLLDTVSEMPTDELHGYTCQIREATTKLLSIGDKARNLEDLLTDDHAKQSSAELDSAIEAVLDDIQHEYPGATIETGDVENVSVAADYTQLATLLEELVGNALEHTGDANPTVELRTVRRDKSVVLTITDYGPGIPEHELDVIRRGDEDALLHGSGLGLWMVNWIVTHLGGTLSFETDETTGTTVNVTLPLSGESQDVAASRPQYSETVAAGSDPANDPNGNDIDD